MATITGNNAGNTLAGTDAADTIFGRGGGDTLSGLKGNDRLFGEPGDDTLVGGLGDDLLDGGAGRDVGSYANNTAPVEAENASYGGRASPAGSWEVASATTGTDSLVSVEAVVGTRLGDTIRGGDGTSDLIRGGAGDDDLLGGQFSGASDTVYGGGGDDAINGGEETQSQRGGAYPGTGDRFFGGGGGDLLVGVDGDDRLSGDAGNDRLSGGPDRDVLTGGAGADLFSYYNIFPDPQDSTLGDFGADLIRDFVRGTDRVLIGAGDTYDASARLDSFGELDSSRNGVLDDADRHVEVRAVTFGGATRVSTVIDVTGYPDGIAGAGEQSLTVFGVTGLRAGDLTFDVREFLGLPPGTGGVTGPRAGDLVLDDSIV